MARDKLITIRIEWEKRKAFGELAKSQNTDTASLLYDFINQCLSGKIDIGIVTGKGNRIDKIDNQLDTNRIDKLETDTQEIDNRLDTIAKKLNDWVEAFDDRLTDSDQGLSDKMISLENRLNALASQLDSQEIGSEIDRIDTDSQLDRQGENPDLLKLQREASIATFPIVEPTGEPSPDELDRPAIEDSEKKIPLPDISIASPIGIDKSSGGEGEPDAIETDGQWLSLQQIAEKKIKGLPCSRQGLSPYAEKWESRKNPTKKGKQYKIPKEYLTRSIE